MLVNWNFDLHAYIQLQTRLAISLSNNIVDRAKRRHKAKSNIPNFHVWTSIKLSSAVKNVSAVKEQKIKTNFFSIFDDVCQKIPLQHPFH